MRRPTLRQLGWIGRNTSVPRTAGGGHFDRFAKNLSNRLSLGGFTLSRERSEGVQPNRVRMRSAWSSAFECVPCSRRAIANRGARWVRADNEDSPETDGDMPELDTF